MHVFSFPRGFCVGIYATNSADACEYVITHAKVNILLVENGAQLRKILSVTTAAPPHPPPTTTVLPAHHQGRMDVCKVEEFNFQSIFFSYLASIFFDVDHF